LQLLTFEDRHRDEHVVFITNARAVMSEFAGIVEMHGGTVAVRSILEQVASS
jgi:hypothetical protein